MAKNQQQENKSAAVIVGNFVHVYSTLANSQTYTRYADNRDQVNDLPQKVVEVHIAGGTGIASKNLITPLGVHTKITREDYDAIKDLHVFKVHVENGFIRVEDSKIDVEAAAGEMNANDPGAPLTPSDYEADKDNDNVPVPRDVRKS